MSQPLRIGTRASPLALWQAHFVADRVRPLVAPRSVDLVEIQTTGDQVRDRPLGQIGGEGVFTKEIQRAILAGTVDVGVHSLKDLPTVAVEGLVLAAVPPRGPVGDVFVSHRHAGFDALPQGAVVGTGSLRRRAQAWNKRPDLKLIDIRGNVETRLRKLKEQDLDGLILAQAGLERLGLGQVVTEVLDSAWMLPAVGQGALGLECREGDEATRRILSQLDDLPTRQAVQAERSLLLSLGGGCQVPIGALATVTGNMLTLRGVVLARDGRQRLEGEISGPAADAIELGRQLAQRLLREGAGQFLQGGESTRHMPSPP